MPQDSLGSKRCDTRAHYFIRNEHNIQPLGLAELNETSRGDFNKGTTKRARTIRIPSPRFLRFLVSHHLGRLLVFPCLSSLSREPGGDPAAFCPLSTTALKRTGLWAAGRSCTGLDASQEVDCAELNPSFLFGPYILAGEKIILFFSSKDEGGSHAASWRCQDG